jgi:MFS family permease
MFGPGTTNNRNGLMDLRNRIGLYGSYFLGMAGIGFTLPYLPLYLGQEGISDRAIGIISTLAALSGLAQFPVGLWSDRLGWRKPFLVASLAAVAASTWFLHDAQGIFWIGLLVILFAENGIGRAVVESLAGAEAAALAPRGKVGEALGALRFWKPIGIVLMTLFGGWMAGKEGGIKAILLPLFIVQCLAVVVALLIHETGGHEKPMQEGRDELRPHGFRLPRDAGLWAFVAAMVLYHAANAPGGVYLGLYLKRDLQAPDRMLAYAFAVSMVAWMLVVWPAGRLADRVGRKPLLIAGWTIMTVRLALVALIQSPELIVANQALDGLGNGLFAVLAAAWVTDRLNDPRRSGEAQVIVGSCLVLGSAIGPAVAGFVVGPLGYRGLFWGLAGVGALATAIVVAFVPETLKTHDEILEGGMVDPMPTTSDLSATA